MRMRLKVLMVFPSVLSVIKSDAGDFSGDAYRHECVETCNGSEQEEHGDHCYYWSTVKKNWEESVSECHNRNGTLAAVTSLDIHNFLMRKVDKQSRLSTTFFWIGGTDEETEGNWKWVDGSDWKFTHWATHKYEQPGGGSSQNCLQIYHNIHANNGWNDLYCSTALPFICSWKVCPRARTDDIAVDEPQAANNGTSKGVWADIVDGNIILPAGVGLGSFIIVVVATVVACKCCQRMKKNKLEREEANTMEVDENPVYHQDYELAEDYERQYSTSEAIDRNDYYEC